MISTGKKASLKPLGRPARSDLDVARTVAWFYAVALTSKKHLRALDRQFGSGSTGTWSRYRYGQASPGPERLEEVEQAYPGTMRYYTAPLWTFMRADQLGKLNPEDLFRQLGEPFISRFIRPAAADGLFWLPDSFHCARDANWVLGLSEYLDTDELELPAALVGLAHVAVMLQDREGLCECVNIWAAYCDEVRDSELCIGGVPPDSFLDFGRGLFEIANKVAPDVLAQKELAMYVFGVRYERVMAALTPTKLRGNK